MSQLKAAGAAVGAAVIAGHSSSETHSMSLVSSAMYRDALPRLMQISSLFSANSPVCCRTKTWPFSASQTQVQAFGHWPPQHPQRSSGSAMTALVTVGTHFVRLRFQKIQ